MIKLGTVASQIADTAENAKEQKKIAATHAGPKSTEEFIAQYIDQQKRKLADGLA